jgi:hypothetical protein
MTQQGVLPVNEEQVQPQEQAPVQSESVGQSDGQQSAKTVPYERLESVSKKNQELEKQIRELNARYESLSQPEQVRQEMEQRKREEEEYWKNPYGFTKKVKEEIRQDFERIQNEAQEAHQYRDRLGQFRNSPEYSQELEGAMSQYIGQFLTNEKGKVLVSPAKAIEAAFQAVTGRKFGEWQQGYSTRQVKERLIRPSGVGGGRAPGMSEDSFKKIPAEEYGKDPKKYNEALVAYLRSLGQ